VTECGDGVPSHKGCIARVVKRTLVAHRWGLKAGGGVGLARGGAFGLDPGDETCGTRGERFADRVLSVFSGLCLGLGIRTNVLDPNQTKNDIIPLATIRTQRSSLASGNNGTICNTKFLRLV
jgi:hypothetical protein